MKWNTTCRFGLLAAAALLPAVTARAANERVLAFQLHQDGFSENAYISGRFTAADRDKNGLIVHVPEGEGGPFPDNEVLSFSMSFSGNSLAPAFTLGLDELFGMIFQLDTGDIGDDPAFDPTLGFNLTEGIGVIGESRFYTSGEGPNNFIGGLIGGMIDVDDFGDFNALAVDSSQELLYVKQVPIPEPTSILLGLCAGLVIAARRRHRSKYH